MCFILLESAVTTHPWIPSSDSAILSTRSSPVTSTIIGLPIGSFSHSLISTYIYKALHISDTLLINVENTKRKIGVSLLQELSWLVFWAYETLTIILCLLHDTPSGSLHIGKSQLCWGLDKAGSRCSTKTSGNLGSLRNTNLQLQ